MTAPDAPWPLGTYVPYTLCGALPPKRYIQQRCLVRGDHAEAGHPHQNYGGLIWSDDENESKEEAMTTTERTSASAAVEGYTDTYVLDRNYNGAAVSRLFVRIRADEVEKGDLLILDSGLSRVTWVTPYTLGNGVTVVHIAGPTNVVRATHEIVTVLRDGT